MGILPISADWSIKTSLAQKDVYAPLWPWAGSEAAVAPGGDIFVSPGGSGWGSGGAFAVGIGRRHAAGARAPRSCRVRRHPANSGTPEAPRATGQVPLPGLDTARRIGVRADEVCPAGGLTEAARMHREGGFRRSTVDCLHPGVPTAGLAAALPWPSSAEPSEDDRTCGQAHFDGPAA